MSDHVCRLFHRATTTGDEEAWRELVSTCQPTLHHRLRALVGRRKLPITPQETEELVQDLWCRVIDLPEGARFRGRSDAELWGWLQRILRRLVLDVERRAATEKRRAEVVGDDWEVERGLTWRETVAEPGPDPERRAVLREEARTLEAACREVTRPAQQPLVLRVLRLALVEGLSSLDVARRLGPDLRPAQVDGLMYRLRRRLAARGLVLPHRASAWAG